MPPKSSLRQLQRWMQAGIRHPGEPTPALATEANLRIRPSAKLDPIDRLEIYRGMYELRLIGALRVDYPKLEAFLGSDQFEELLRLYLRQYPSRSYTLNRLGDRLPGFIREVDGLPSPRLVEDLARLELAETLVFDEVEVPPDRGLQLEMLDASDWEELRFEPIAALRLLRLSYAVHLANARLVRRRGLRILVYRRHFAIRHLELSQPAFTLFEAIIGGAKLGSALNGMLAAGGATEAEVFSWFRLWFAEGLFARIIPPANASSNRRRS